MKAVETNIPHRKWSSGVWIWNDLKMLMIFSKKCGNDPFKTMPCFRCFRWPWKYVIHVSYILNHFAMFLVQMGEFIYSEGFYIFTHRTESQKQRLSD